MDFQTSISVVMPVYNTPTEYLKEAVESILVQSFEDFEFIIIDDGSTNGNADYLDSLNDQRIRIIRNPHNIGITRSLNIGLRAAMGKYIARMDSDDISFPNRLAIQYSYMESHSNVVACGTLITSQLDFSLRDLDIHYLDRPVDMDQYRVKMLFVNPGPSHPTAFFRHDTLIEHGVLYDEKLTYSQSYGMWETLSGLGRIQILDAVLLFHRKHEDQITHAHREQQIKCDQMVQAELLEKLLKVTPTDSELDLHYYCSTGYYSDAKISPDVDKWYDRLIKANREQRLFSQRKLKKEIETIKLRLIEQSFDSRGPKIKKAMLLLRYLPFFVAIKTIIKKSLNKGPQRKQSL